MTRNINEIYVRYEQANENYLYRAFSATGINFVVGSQTLFIARMLSSIEPAGVGLLIEITERQYNFGPAYPHRSNANGS